MMKVAVIGCGTIANGQHIPAYMANKKAEIKYFCDIIPERAEAAVQKYGCGIAVTDYKQVLADPEIEAVSVCTPNRMHSIITVDALKAGKNVLCEKPAARLYEEALEMQKAQHESGKVLNIGVVNRFNRGVERVREAIQSGEIGEVIDIVKKNGDEKEVEDEDEEVLGSNQSNVAQSTISRDGAPKRSKANTTWNTGKTVKSVFDQTASGEGEPAGVSREGAPKRSKFSKEPNRSKTVSSRLQPGKHIFEIGK